MSGRRTASVVTPPLVFDPGPVPSDRRIARRYHTRLDLIEATIDLFLAGNPHPTSRQVAEQAEVSPRTLFNHYHIDRLYGDAAATQVLRSLTSIAPVPPQGPVAVRIGATCRQRRQLFEQIATVLHAVQSRPAATPVLDKALDELGTLLTHQMDFTFSREISRRSDGSSLVVLLDVPTGWESWISLRFRRRLTAPEAERQLAAFMTEVLA